MWACLLGGWLGWVFALLVCSLGVFACLLVCARLGVVGQCGSAAPHHAHCPLAAWAFGAHAPRVGALLCVRSHLGCGV